jgi:hypothetical protein
MRSETFYFGNESLLIVRCLLYTTSTSVNFTTTTVKYNEYLLYELGAGYLLSMVMFCKSATCYDNE